MNEDLVQELCQTLGRYFLVTLRHIINATETFHLTIYSERNSGEAPEQGADRPGAR